MNPLTVPCLRAAFTWHPRLTMTMRWTTAMSDASTDCTAGSQYTLLLDLGVVKEQIFSPMDAYAVTSNLTEIIID